MFDFMSRQPLIIVSPLNLILQHLPWNQITHPTSQRTDTYNRLLVIPGAQWASRAVFGSFESISSRVLVVNIQALVVSPN